MAAANGGLGPAYSCADVAMRAKWVDVSASNDWVDVGMDVSAFYVKKKLFIARHAFFLFFPGVGGITTAQ